MSKQQLILVRKKYKTFEEICPEWAYILKHYSRDEIDYIKTPRDISDNRVCIVGEAHGDSSDYKCYICQCFSEKFCYVEFRFKGHVDQFVNHFNEEHVHE